MSPAEQDEVIAHNAEEQHGECPQMFTSKLMFDFKRMFSLLSDEDPVRLDISAPTADQPTPPRGA